MYQRILVGTDGSPRAQRAVDRAVEVAAATGATVTIACAGDRPVATEILAAERARLAETEVALETEVLEGEPADALLDRAAVGGFDLLVVGNRGMTGPARFLLGSVPNKISHHAPCTLLIVQTT